MDDKSFDELLKLAESGEAEAQYKLALRYHKANGVEKDFEKAIHWYKKAAEQDDEDAIKTLERLNNC